MNLQKIKQFAQKYGFNSVQKLGAWKDYVVYAPFKFPVKGVIPPTGLPSFILEKDGKLEWAFGEKAFLLLTKFNI